MGWTRSRPPEAPPGWAQPRSETPHRHEAPSRPPFGRQTDQGSWRLTSESYSLPRMNQRAWASTLGLALAAVCFAAPAYSHISLEQGGTHKSRYGDSEIKAGPCGRAGGTRGTNIYTYEPGQTITISLVEYVQHPSYFRWAFDADGDGTFKEPASIKPIDPTRPCPIDNGDHCGASDYYNNAAVLPGMDDLNPHMPTSGSSPKYTWQVTLPNVECANCTLQVIQVMEDNLLHGDYDPTPGVGVEDIYHQCIDLVLKKGASNADGGVSGGGDSGTQGDDDSGAQGGDDSGTQGGGSIDGGGGGAGADGSAPGGGNGGGSAASASSQGSGGCAVTDRGASQAFSVAWSVFALGLLGVVRRRRART